MRVKASLLKKPVIFFDFDNTITTFDILDDMLARFSRDDKWMALEDRWNNGEIGSRECLKGQVEGIAITKKALDKYLSGIELDPFFAKLVKFLGSKGIRIFILSDNFEYTLKKILENNGIEKMSIYANSLKIEGDRLWPGFPLTNASCGDCAHCKKTSMLSNAAVDSTSVYIGDGRSDICAAEAADMVFAKGYLKDYLKKKRLPHLPFEDLEDVYDYFRGSIE